MGVIIGNDFKFQVLIGSDQDISQFKVQVQIVALQVIVFCGQIACAQGIAKPAGGEGSMQTKDMKAGDGKRRRIRTAQTIAPIYGGEGIVTDALAEQGTAVQGIGRGGVLQNQCIRQGAADKSEEAASNPEHGRRS